METNMARTFRRLFSWVNKRIETDEVNADPAAYIWGTDQPWRSLLAPPGSPQVVKLFPKRMEDAMAYSSRTLAKGHPIEGMNFPDLSEAMHKKVKVVEHAYFARLTMRALFLYGREKNLFHLGTVGHMLQTMDQWLEQVSANNRGVQRTSGTSTFQVMLLLGPFFSTEEILTEATGLDKRWLMALGKPTGYVTSQIEAFKAGLDQYTIYITGLRNAAFLEGRVDEPVTIETVEEEVDPEVSETASPNGANGTTFLQLGTGESTKSTSKNGNAGVLLGFLEESVANLVVQQRQLREEMAIIRGQELQVVEGRLLEGVHLISGATFKFLPPTRKLLPAEFKAVVIRIIEHSVGIELTGDLLAAIDRSAGYAPRNTIVDRPDLR